MRLRLRKSWELIVEVPEQTGDLRQHDMYSQELELDVVFRCGYCGYVNSCMNSHRKSQPGSNVPREARRQRFGHLLVVTQLVGGQHAPIGTSENSMVGSVTAWSVWDEAVSTHVKKRVKSSRIDCRTMSLVTIEGKQSLLCEVGNRGVLCYPPPRPASAALLAYERCMAHQFRKCSAHHGFIRNTTPILLWLECTYGAKRRVGDATSRRH